MIEKAAESKDKGEVLYDFDLMHGGGHVTGRKIDDPEILENIAEGLEKLSQGRDLLFAVGDGNHSLATAQSIWKKIKDAGGEDVMNHPARWALVEVVNILGEGLQFEPIHRVLFHVDPNGVLEDLQGRGSCTLQPMKDRDVAIAQMDGETAEHRIGYISPEGPGLLTIEDERTPLPAEALQSLLDSYLQEHNDVEIDYIHGEKTLIRLGSQPGSIGFLLPPQDKGAFFQTIIDRGAFPRKTFSIGEAEEKRYYIEARRIVP